MATLKIINGLQTGDIHLGHRRTPTTNIIRSLNYIFFEKNNLKDVDVVFIAGDVWDYLLNMPDSDAMLGRQWIRGFVKACEVNDVIVRVLEGTPDHDWKQSKEFVAFETTCDIKHVTELSIEFHEKLGISILYVPDECRPTVDAVWRDVCGLLTENNLTQVDLAIVHSGFDFQYPPGLGITCHDSALYSSIVKYGAFANHVHIAAQKDKVYGPGSPDRLSHGEEGDKGYHSFTINKATEELTVRWIVNPHAWRYKAIDVTGMKPDVILSVARQEASKLHAGAYIRLDYGNALEVRALIKSLALEFPSLVWEYKDKKKTKREQQDTEFLKKKFSSPNMSRDNAESLIVDWINRKKPTEPTTLNKVIEIIKTSVSEIR